MKIQILLMMIMIDKPKFLPDSSWTLIEPGLDAPIDFEISYYKLQTEDLVGSDKTAKILYLDEHGENAGGIQFQFGKIPNYVMEHCSSGFKPFHFHTDSGRRIREGTNKWLIEKRGLRTIVFFDGKQILDMTISSKTCEMPWEEYWGRKVAKLQFHGSWNDTTNYYMIGSFHFQCFY